MSGDGPISIPPEELDADPEERVREWAETIDRIDYLTLLGLSSLLEPTDDEIREAWRAFALSFHPDRHRDSEDDVRGAATRVFQRGAEAYRVLQDPVLRKRYLRLVAEGHLRMPQDEVAQSRRGTDRLQDIVRSAGASPFAIRADELIAKGDLKQARLQLQLAVMREPANTHLAERLRDLDELLAAGRRP